MPEYLRNGERSSCQTGLILLVHITNYGNTINTACNQIQLQHTETAKSTRNKQQQRHSVLINIQPYPIVSDKIAAYRFREEHLLRFENGRNSSSRNVGTFLRIYTVL